MVESQGKEVDNEIMIRAFEFGQKIVSELCEAQNDFIAKYKQAYEITQKELKFAEENPEIEKFVEKYLQKSDIDGLYGLGKIEFHDAIGEIIEDISIKITKKHFENTTEIFDEAKEILEENNIRISEIADEIKSRVKSDMREKILSGGTRLDGRDPNEVRPVTADVAILPRAHGSGLFERGVTQVLSVATLGGPSDIQIIDDMYEEDLKRYIHHYNFPPYSVGEVRPLR